VDGTSGGDDRPFWRRWVPHWPLVLVLALGAALVLWFASYGVAR
jgi:hypothetical protein